MDGNAIALPRQCECIVLNCCHPARSFGGRLATCWATTWFFVFEFEKSDRANISDDKLEGLQLLAHDLLARTNRQLDEAIADGALLEICHDYKI